MTTLGIFFGSSDGNTARVAELLAQQFRMTFGPLSDVTVLGVAGVDVAGLDVEVLDIAEYYVEDMADFDLLLLGIPTWNHGQLQADWEAALDEFDDLDLAGKRAAVFGLGDQVGYPDTFADAVFFLVDRLRNAGAELAGAWPCDGYTFRGSWAVEDGRFLGLILDEVNQAELTPARLAHWVQILGVEFGIVAPINQG